MWFIEILNSYLYATNWMTHCRAVTYACQALVSRSFPRGDTVRKRLIKTAHSEERKL
jgi:hypothetical protein